MFTIPDAATEIILETGQLAIELFHCVRVTGLDTLDQQAPRKAAVAERLIEVHCRHRQVGPLKTLNVPGPVRESQIP